MPWKYDSKTGAGTLIRRQHFVVIFFDRRGSFHGTLKYHKIGTKLGYYIRIADYYYLWITVVNTIEDCVKMLILRLCFCYSEVASRSLWSESVVPVSHLCLTNRRPLFLICAWKIDFWPRRYDFLSDTMIFNFKVKGIAVNIRKLLTFDRYASCDFLLVTQVTQNISRTRWAIPIPPCAPGWANRDCFPPQHLLIYISSIPTNLHIFLFTQGLLERKPCGGNKTRWKSFRNRVLVQRHYFFMGLVISDSSKIKICVKGFRACQRKSQWNRLDGRARVGGWRRARQSPLVGYWPVALVGYGSNCFSITQLYHPTSRTEKGIIKLANVSWRNIFATRGLLLIVLQ